MSSSSARVRCSTIIFKLTSVFFSKFGCHTKDKNPVWPNIHS